MKYSDSNKETRIKHFELLNKLVVNNSLSMEDSESFIKLLINENPYTYKRSPKAIVKKPNIKEKNLNIKGYYNQSRQELVYMLKNGLKLKDMKLCFKIIGHEMKHFIQHNSLNNYLRMINNDNKSEKFRHHITSSIESLSANKYANPTNINKVIKAIPLKAAINPSIAKLKFFSSSKTNLRYSSYLTLYHEYDAFKSQEYFYYGMMKSYDNDPLIEGFPALKSYFENTLKVNTEHFDKSLKSELDKLNSDYKMYDKQLNRLSKTFIKLAKKGKLPNNANCEFYTAHLLNQYYDKETIKKVIDVNLYNKSNLSFATTYYALFKCPKQDLKEIQDIYYQNVISKIFPQNLHPLLTDEQNQLIIHDLIKNKDIKNLNNNIINFAHIKDILSPEFKHILTQDIITNFNDKRIKEKDLFNLSCSIIPLLDNEDAEKISSFTMDRLSNKLKINDENIIKNDENTL